jgi:hypothetical protein
LSHFSKDCRSDFYRGEVEKRIPRGCDGDQVGDGIFWFSLLM